MPTLFFSFRKLKAFTLIELLLVVSIIIIITGAILPGFSTYIQEQSVTQSREQVKTDLRTLQNRSLTGQNALDLVGTNTYPSYWGVRFIAESNTYIFFISQSNGACPPTTNIIQKGTSRPLPGDAVIKTSRCLFFNMTNGNMNPYPVTGTVEVIVGRANVNTKCKRIQITTEGLIDVSSTNQACS